MTYSIRIDTPRLYIREIRDEDAEGMFELDSDPDVHRFIGNKTSKSLDEVRHNIHLFQEQYRDLGIARWAVVEKESGKFIGWTGFKRINDTINGRSGFYDFGYRLQQKHWGKGYAFEASRAALDYGLENLKLSPVTAMTDIDHVVSGKVLVKLGFVHSGTFEFDGPPTPWRDPGELTKWFDLPAHKLI